MLHNVTLIIFDIDASLNKRISVSAQCWLKSHQHQSCIANLKLLTMLPVKLTLPDPSPVSVFLDPSHYTTYSSQVLQLKFQHCTRFHLPLAPPSDPPL